MGINADKLLCGNCAFYRTQEQEHFQLSKHGVMVEINTAINVNGFIVGLEHLKDR